MKKFGIIIAASAIATAHTISHAWSEDMTQIGINEAVSALFAASNEFDAALELTNTLRDANESFSLVVAKPNTPDLIAPEAYRATDGAVAIIRIGDAIYLWTPKDNNALTPFFLE